MTATFLQGNARDVLKTLPEGKGGQEGRKMKMNWKRFELDLHVWGICHTACIEGDINKLNELIKRLAEVAPQGATDRTTRRANETISLLYEHLRLAKAYLHLYGIINEKGCLG